MNQIQQTQNIKLSESEAFIYQNYKSCHLHPKRQISYISTRTDSAFKYHLQCIDCLPFRKENYTLIPLLTLLESDKKTIFKSWPIQDDSEIYDILVELSNRKSFVEEKQTQIASYFKLLKSDLDRIISEKEKEMLICCEQLWDLNDQVIQQYNQVAAKDELKDIILNQKDDFEQQNRLIAQSIQKTLNNLERNKQLIIDSIIHLRNQEKTFDFDGPENIKKNIIQQIKEINIFVLKIFDDIKQTPKDSILNQYKHELNEYIPKQMTTSQLIVKLMSNKFNNCSQQLIEQLQITIANIQPYLDKCDVKTFINEDILNYQFNHDLDMINLTKLNKDQCKEINCLVEYLLKNFKLAVKLISLLIKIQIHNQEKPLIKLSELDENQFMNIQKLVEKIALLSNYYGDDYKKSKVPNQQQIVNSYIMNQYNKNCISKTHLAQLLVDFPILELQNLKFQYFQNLEFQIAYNNALQLEKNKVGNYIIRNKGNPVNLYGQVATKYKLDSNTNYIFRCKSNEDLANKNFSCFGIMNIANINSKKLYQDDSKCSYKTTNTGYGLSNIIKGDNLGNIKEQITCVEIRLNLSKQLLFFADYPNYNNVNQTNPEKIKQNIDYCFCVYLNSSHEYEIEIESYTCTDGEDFIIFQ